MKKCMLDDDPSAAECSNSAPIVPSSLTKICVLKEGIKEESEKRREREREREREKGEDELGVIEGSRETSIMYRSCTIHIELEIIIVKDLLDN